MNKFTEDMLEDVMPWIGIALVLAWIGFLIWLWVRFWKETDLLKAIKLGTVLIACSFSSSSWASSRRKS